jgi:hypothetical protein
MTKAKTVKVSTALLEDINTLLDEIVETKRRGRAGPATMAQNGALARRNEIKDHLSPVTVDPEPKKASKAGAKDTGSKKG